MTRPLALLAILLTAACAPRPAPPGPAAAANPPRKSGAAATQLTVKGSDTMVLLAQKWAETYMDEHPETAIQVTGGGSGTGIAAILDGTTDIANSSRPIKSSELDAAREKGREVVEHRVAQDALCVVVNAANPVAALSMAQLRAIFTGAVTNWSVVGGDDAPIIVYSRESNSGTYAFFKEHVLLDADFVATAQTLPGTAALATAVTKDRNGIGYGGAAYFLGNTTTRVVEIKRDKDSPALSPLTADGVNVAVIRDLSYPISRYLYCYTLGEPQGAVKEYLDWILSPAGQRIVEELDYVPMVTTGA
ncbi:MAG TPA: PstS family phosphate ABC transporter substrate-binding protein [bacterium]|nr:PstS family phosphate ABC transporter substrate-binding protein [bacterium]